MKFKIALIALIALIVLATTSIANASLLIEPQLGYIVSGKQSDWNGLEMKHTGPQYGARLGAQYLGLMGGFAYFHSSYKLDASAFGVTISEKQKQDDLGVFLGYSAPVLLRVWVAYYFSSKMTATETTTGFGHEGDYYKGKTTEFGLGLTPLPLVSLNLIYRMTSFDKINTAAGEASLSPKYEPKEIVLAVSVPFHLL